MRGFTVLAGTMRMFDKRCLKTWKGCKIMGKLQTIGGMHYNGVALILFILAIGFGWRATSQTPNAPSGQYMELTIGCHSGLPNPKLVITDQAEIDYIVGILRNSLQAGIPTSATQPSSPGYSGVSLRIRGVDSISGNYRIYHGTIFINGMEKRVQDQGKLEQYLVPKVLNSNETLNNVKDAKIQGMITKEVQEI